jgi:DNA-binding Xre family transcriptional regulator
MLKDLPTPILQPLKMFSKMITPRTNLERVMREKGITQRELLEKMIEQGCKIDLPRINKYVTGKLTNLTYNTLRSLSVALDCSIQDLM